VTEPINDVGPAFPGTMPFVVTTGPVRPEQQAAIQKQIDEARSSGRPLVLPNSIGPTVSSTGLSKREWFAGMAMQGILASTQGLIGSGFGPDSMKKLVAKAFMLADLALSMDADEKQTDPQQDGPRGDRRTAQ
jgi:hypothetical protein